MCLRCRTEAAIATSLPPPVPPSAAPLPLPSPSFVASASPSPACWPRPLPGMLAGVPAGVDAPVPVAAPPPSSEPVSIAAGLAEAEATPGWKAPGMAAAVVPAAAAADAPPAAAAGTAAAAAARPPAEREENGRVIDDQGRWRAGDERDWLRAAARTRGSHESFAARPDVSLWVRRPGRRPHAQAMQGMEVWGWWGGRQPPCMRVGWEAAADDPESAGETPAARTGKQLESSEQQIARSA